MCTRVVIPAFRLRAGGDVLRVRARGVRGLTRKGRAGIIYPRAGDGRPNTLGGAMIIDFHTHCYPDALAEGGEFSKEWDINGEKATIAITAVK